MASEGGVLDPKGRRDHIVPQVYLRGFIHPERDRTLGRLEAYLLASNTWGASLGTDELCSEIGFYDYSVDQVPVTADTAFKELEDGLHNVRAKLRRDNFKGWKSHREFLLRFGKMLAVRSKMFREGVIAAARRQEHLRVLEVNGNTLQYEPMDISSEPHAEALLKNRSITEMRTEIEKGAQEWNDWDWGLRRAPSVMCPFVTSDHPPVMDGHLPPDRVYASGRFRIVIPFGWDFALAGGPTFSEKEGPVYLPPDEMDEYRIISTSGAQKLLISPIRLLDMKWFGRVEKAVPLRPR